MIIGIQLIGILFGLAMLYLTYTHYKKKDFTWRSMLVWATVWLAFIVLMAFPQTVYGIMQALHIQRTADFFVMAGFVLYALIIFYLYIGLKKNEKRVEGLVRALAHEHPMIGKKTTVKKKRPASR